MHLFLLVAAAAAEAIEVGAAPRSLPPPQSACLECCSACSECRSACCSPTRPKTVWTPFKNFVSVILKLVEFVLPTPNGKCNNAQQTDILLCLSLITDFVKLMSQCDCCGNLDKCKTQRCTSVLLAELVCIRRGLARVTQQQYHTTK